MMVLQFIAGMISCIGFAFLFNCPKKAICQSAIAGGLGWIAYAFCLEYLSVNTVVATLIGTLVLSTICEILSHIKKDAMTIFVIPAILPLVPGAGLYYTLRYLIEGNLELALNKGLATIGCALSIAIGIIVVSSLSRLFLAIVRKKGKL